MKKIRDIKIQQLDKGYLVTVGCKQLAVESRHDIIIHLSQYLDDPEGMEKQYRELYGWEDTMVRRDYSESPLRTLAGDEDCDQA